MVRLLTHTLCAVALLVSGCGGDEAAPATTSTTTTTAAPTTTTTTTSPTVAPPTTTAAPVETTTTTAEPGVDWVFTASDDLPVVSLIDPGDEPLRVRTYTMEPGAIATATMRNGLAIEQSIDGTTTLSLDSDIATEMISTVVDEGPLGTTVRSTFGASTVESADPQTRAAFQAVYDGLEGLTLYALLSPQGAVLATDTSELPPELAGLTQSVAGAAAPLPEEAFGVGAVWEVTSAVVVAGTTFVQTATVEVIDIDGDLLTVTMKVEQTLGPDGFKFPGIETVAVDLLTTGSGNAVWDLTSPIPPLVASTAEQNLTATLAIDGQEATLGQVTLMTLEIN